MDNTKELLYLLCSNSIDNVQIAILQLLSNDLTCGVLSKEDFTELLRKRVDEPLDETFFDWQSTPPKGTYVLTISRLATDKLVAHVEIKDKGVAVNPDGKEVYSLKVKVKFLCIQDTAYSIPISSHLVTYSWNMYDDQSQDNPLDDIKKRIKDVMDTYKDLIFDAFVGITRRCMMEVLCTMKERIEL